MATEIIQSTPQYQATHTHATAQAVSSLQVGAILLAAAGWGWIAGNFVQPTNTPWGVGADILHAIPLALVLAFGLRYIGAGLRGSLARGARAGLTAVAIYGVLGCAVMIVLGAINPDPNSVGVHSPQDWMPVIVLNAGTLLWLGTLIFGRER